MVFLTYEVTSLGKKYKRKKKKKKRKYSHLSKNMAFKKYDEVS